MMVFVYSITYLPYLPYLMSFYSSNGKEERGRERDRERKGIDFPYRRYRPSLYDVLSWVNLLSCLDLLHPRVATLLTSYM